MMYTVVFCAALVAFASAAQLSGNEPIPILRQENINAGDGQWKSSYETGNGIVAEEQGQLKNAGSEQEAVSVQGQFQYKADDGSNIQLSYIADENGFQPQGAHLPVAPPIPEAILRSIEWNAAHPEPEEKPIGGKRF